MDIDVKLLKCVNLMTDYHKLIDTCMVHFITDDLFKLIPEGRVSPPLCNSKFFNKVI